MAELSWFGVGIYILTVMAIVLWATIATGRLRERLKPDEQLIKKITIGILVVSGGYWYVTVPYAGNYYDFSDHLSYPENLADESVQSKYLGDHHQRIEKLELELKNQREESRKLRDHYQLILQLAWYGLLYFGCMSIFGTKQIGSSEDIIKLDLDK